MSVLINFLLQNLVSVLSKICPNFAGHVWQDSVWTYKFRELWLLKWLDRAVFSLCPSSSLTFHILIFSYETTGHMFIGTKLCINDVLIQQNMAAIVLIGWNLKTLLRNYRSKWSVGAIVVVIVW
jgi:hypothetical protein